MSRARKRTQKEKKRRQRRLTMVGGGAILAVIVAVLVVLATRPLQAPIPEGAVARYSELPQGTTEEGFPRLGDTEAPVEVVEYSSFSCPNCETFHRNVTLNLLDRVRLGQISFTYVPLFGFGNLGDGQTAARAAVCAGEQDSFWAFHDALFDWQARFLNQAFTPDRLEAGIETLGLNVSEWNACMGSDAPGEVLDAARAASDAELDFNGAPALYVNGLLVRGDLLTVNNAISAALAEAEADTADEIEEADAESTPTEAATEVEEADAEGTPTEAAAEVEEADAEGTPTESASEEGAPTEAVEEDSGG